jgi:hypothetical protein
VTIPKTDAVSGRDGGAPTCLGTALVNRRDRGEEGGSKGVRDQLAARWQDEGNRVEEVSAHRFSLFPVDCSTPVPGLSGRTSAGRVWRDSFRAVAELPKVLIGERWGRVAIAVPIPSQPGPAGPHQPRAAVRDGTPAAPHCRAIR